MAGAGPIHAAYTAVFIIGPDKKVKSMLNYAMSTVQNFDELLCLLGACQLTASTRWRRR